MMVHGERGAAMLVHRRRQKSWRSTSSLILLVAFTSTTSALTIAVFGGSGYIGRRVCRALVESGRCDEVLSISRRGRPPSYYCDPSWSDAVRWIKYDADPTGEGRNNDDLTSAEGTLDLPPIDAAISCVGNVQPSQEWKQLWGLGFDDDSLRHENGAVNERIVELSKEAGAQRFAFVSVSYEVAKALEGPIEGYINGKRHAETKACETFGEDNTIVVGPSLVYGGERFSKLGKLYRSLVESTPAKAYVAGNEFLRGLSSAPMQDWVEKMLFSPPCEVNSVARVLSAGALGMIDRGMVGQRRQGFFDTNGKPVTYSNPLFVDGTNEIERIDDAVDLFSLNDGGKNGKLIAAASAGTSALPSSSLEGEEAPQPFEGALIGKRPYLYPLPVAASFLSLFWSVATQQFIQVVPIQ